MNFVWLMLIVGASIDSNSLQLSKNRLIALSSVKAQKERDVVIKAKRPSPPRIKYRLLLPPIRKKSAVNSRKTFIIFSGIGITAGITTYFIIHISGGNPLPFPPFPPE